MNLSDVVGVLGFMAVTAGAVLCGWVVSSSLVFGSGCGLGVGGSLLLWLAIKSALRRHNGSEKKP